MVQEYIRLRGARENNLQNISLDIPKRKITIFTGVSGSGKSSIVFETIATESQRQLNETYSAYLRNFLPKYSSRTQIQLKTSPPLLLLIKNDLAVIPAPPLVPSRILIRFCDYFSRVSASLVSGQQIYFLLTTLLVCALIAMVLDKKFRLI